MAEKCNFLDSTWHIYFCLKSKLNFTSLNLFDFEKACLGHSQASLPWLDSETESKLANSGWNLSCALPAFGISVWFPKFLQSITSHSIHSSDVQSANVKIGIPFVSWYKHRTNFTEHFIAMTGSQRTWGLGPTWTRITGLWKQESHVGIANITWNLWTFLTSWDPAAAWHTWKLFDLEPTLNSMDCPALLARHKTPRTSRIWCHTRERHHEPLCKQEMFGNQNDVYEDIARSCTSPRTICCALRSRLYQLTGAKTHLSYRYHDHVDVSRSFLSMAKEIRDSSEVGEAKTEKRKAPFFTPNEGCGLELALGELRPCLCQVETWHVSERSQNSEFISSAVSL